MKKLLLSILFLALMAPTTPLQASHLAGGDIDYQWVGGNIWNLKLAAYRDCSGINLGTTGQSICVKSDCGDLWNVPVPLVPPSPIEVSQLCDDPSIVSTCQGGPWPGMQQFVFEDTTTLPVGGPDSICDTWEFSWSQSARNPSTNTTNAGQFIVTAGMVWDNDSSNSSPSFTAQPIPYVCINQTVDYNFGVTEPDGDSIYATFTQPLNGSCLNQSFVNMDTANGYTVLAPIPGITINNANSQLNFTPTVIGNFVVAVRVEEYDPPTGNFIGWATRDIQFIVQNCANQVPNAGTGITNFQGTGIAISATDVEVCLGQTFSFDVIFNDPNAGDSITATTNFDSIFPGATFTQTGGNPDTVSLSWTAVPGTGAFTPFFIQAEDNACPVTGISFASYGVHVIPTTYLGPDFDICNLDTGMLTPAGGDTFSYQVINGPPIQLGVNFWTNATGDTAWVAFQDTVTLRTVSNLSGTCQNDDTITINVFHQYPVDITPVPTLCVGEPVTTLTAATPGGTWSGTGILDPINGFFNPLNTNPPVDDSSTVTIVYQLPGACANVDTAMITVMGWPSATITSPGPFCQESTTPQPLTTSSPSPGTWSGPFVDPTGTITPNLFPDPDTYSYPIDTLIYLTTDNGVCQFTDSLVVSIIDEYETDLDSLPPLCEEGALVVDLYNYVGEQIGTFSSVTNGGETTLGSNLSAAGVLDQNGLDPGDYDLRYTITGLCGGSSDTTITVNPLPDVTITDIEDLYCDNIEDTVVFGTAVSGEWGGNAVLSPESGSIVPSELGVGTYTVSNYFLDPNTYCENKDETTFTIAETPVRPRIFNFSPFCAGQSRNRLEADGLRSNTYTWYSSFPHGEGNDDTIGVGNPYWLNNTFTETFEVWVTQTSDEGCESEPAHDEIDIRPAPVADFTATQVSVLKDQVILFTNLSKPDTFDLDFTWIFGDQGFPVKETNPRYAFEQIGTFDVILQADNGLCSDTARLRIEVDATFELEIPNVFTPNGDGENDEIVIFHESIAEFEMVIYNRWGREVARITDPSEPWDGDGLKDGVYYWVANYTVDNLSRDEKIAKGDITILGSNK